jgi:hypothetical protein
MSQCKSVTKDGKRCKRQALPGRRYCWQHESSKVKILSFGALVGIVLTIIGLFADLRGLGVPIPPVYNDQSTTETPSSNQANTNLSDLPSKDEQLNDLATQQAQANAMLASLATGVAVGQVDTLQATVIFEQLQGTAVALEQTATAIQNASTNMTKTPPPPETSTPPTPFELTLAAQDPMLIALQDLNIRNGPGKEYGVVGTMFKGQKLKLLATSDDYYWKIECPKSAYVHECWVTGGNEYSREINVVALPVISDSYDRTNLWDFEVIGNEKDEKGETILITIAHHYDIPYIGTICLMPELLYNNQIISPPDGSYLEIPCFDGYVGVATMEIKLAVADNESVISDQMKISMILQDNEKFIYSKTFDYYKVWENSQQ